MSKIFISYRRSDSPDVTGRIFDHLCRSFGRDHVFRDLDSLPPGADFRAVITKAVQACDVVIVIIGMGWLKAKNKKGESKLSDPNDFVRVEIEGALAREIPIVPVLVGGAKMPAPEALPSSIEPLAFRGAIQVRSDPDFTNDAQRLVRALRPVLKPKTPLWTVSIFVGLLSALILLSITGMYIRGKMLESRRKSNDQSVNSQTSLSENNKDKHETTPSEANSPLRSASPDSLVHNLDASSKKDYRLTTFQEGAMAYFDRSFVYTDIPSFLRGQSFIVTANEDKCPDDPSAFNLKFDVSRPVVVYIAHDDRYVRKPSWMSDFAKTKESISLAYPGGRQRYSLYQKDFSPGTIVLGSNIDNRCQEGSFGMYSVVIVPRG